MKIAIVDDHEDCLQNLSEAVMACGHEAICIQGGFNGKDLDGVVLAIVEANPDFVLLDHDMRTSKGDEVATLINMSPDKLIGTSDRKQPYCGRRLPGSMDKSYATTMVGEDFQKLFV